jgi:hypothetical protein
MEGSLHMLSTLSSFTFVLFMENPFIEHHSMGEAVTDEEGKILPSKNQQKKTK